MASIHSSYFCAAPSSEARGRARSRAGGSTLNDMIDAERHLFNLDDDAVDGRLVTDGERDARDAEIHGLRAAIDRFPVADMADLCVKAAYVERLFAESDETLDQAIEASGRTDEAFGLVIVRDLLTLIRRSHQTPL